ncbi:MAG TPA: hypothetical protein VKB88_32565 [Bryobacteraceae bacterium]|nr:hypothetical protein [Bryobacteraceae bacterium]
MAIMVARRRRLHPLAVERVLQNLDLPTAGEPPQFPYALLERS